MLVWSLIICLSTTAFANTLLFIPGENLTIECSIDALTSQRREITGMYLYRDDERLAHYNNPEKNQDKFTLYKDMHRFVKTGNFKKNNITIINVTVSDSGFYRCAYYIFDQCEIPQKMYRVISDTTDKSSQKPTTRPTTTSKTPTSESTPILIIAITAAISIIITMIFSLCVIPKVNKWRYRGEPREASAQNIYEVMTRNGIPQNQRGGL
ncbi:uncharacterized protein [Eucyclogobius newberryi]|uniref:uncharacterized protein n=1 Tax=Eucyclogobius newberryi TaxID=166745 RepID=UPI003B5940B5